MLEAVSKPTTQEPYGTWRIRTFSDYAEYLAGRSPDRYSMFRGQREDWPLLPRVARIHADASVLVIEKILFNNFKREAVAYLSLTPRSDWDWLSIAQHHTLPTRLLDWTKNPLAALWFTVKRGRSRGRSHGVIWVFHPDDEDIIRDPGTEESPFDGGRTKVFEPRHVTDRIRAQESVFTVHKYVKEQEQFVPLERNRRQRGRLEKVIVPRRAFGRLVAELDRCGTHAATLFPDLDGLATRLRARYERTNRTS